MAELDPEVKNWSRRTVADGKWLDDNTIKPIKEHLERLYDSIPTNAVKGVKGAAETTYRTGNVSISTTDIGAAALSHSHGNISNDGKSTTEPASTTKYLRADGTWSEPPGTEQVNADWNATTGKAKILNKPQNLVQDANYVHTDNNFTTNEKNKLAGIAEGAEANVQSDWSITDSSSDSYIKNKPTIPTVYNSKITIQGNGTEITNFTLNQNASKTVNITPSNIGAVPTTRTVNGKALSSNITLSAGDVGAVPTTRTVNGKALSSNITLSASDVGASPTGHKHSAADITSGKLAVARGGTGQDTLQKAGNAIINALPVESVDPVDNDYFISQQANGGTTNTGFYRRKLSALWNWILSKLSSTDARKASNGSSIGSAFKPVFVGSSGTIAESSLTLKAKVNTSGSGQAGFDKEALVNATYKIAFAVKTSDLVLNVPYSIWGGVKGAIITNNESVNFTVYQANGTTFPLGPGAAFNTHSTTNIHNGAALVVRFSTTGIYYCPCY